MLDSSSNYVFKHMVLVNNVNHLLLIEMIFLDLNIKLKGIDSVKTDITKELIKLFQKKLKR